MTIIDKIKPPSPILTYAPKPSFKTELEKQRYWEKEKIKWVEGVGDIPGTLYHKTQEQQIKDRDSGEIFKPICRDADLLVHQEIRSARIKEEAVVLIKGRGFGLSSEFGCLSNYFMKVCPGTTVLMTSESKDKISDLFSEKVAVTYDNYDEEIKPVEIRRNETSASCFLRTEQIYKDKNNKEQIGKSKILCRETTQTPKSSSAFSGTGAIFGAYDELFLHPRRKELIRSSTSCFMNQRTRKVTGFLLCGGTVEDTLNNDQLSELQKMIIQVQNSGRLETMKARLVFVPFWMGSFMTNGWSDEKKGMEWWETEMEALEKLGDNKAARAFKMNNPRSFDDIFELSSGNRWESDVTEKIKVQYNNVVKENIPEIRCNLVDINGNIETQLNKKGNVFILENPKQNIEYYLCVDGVATGKESGEEEGSNVAGTIVKMFDPAGDNYSPVCIYTERPDTVEQSYINLASQATYYNKFGGLKGIMAEANAGTSDHFATFLRKNGLEKWILNRKDLSGKGYSNTKKAFQYIDINGRDWQMRQANIFLRKHIQVIKMKGLLLDMMSPATDNADILDSWLMFFIAAGADFDKPYVRPKPRIKQRRMMVMRPDGRVEVEWQNYTT